MRFYLILLSVFLSLFKVSSIGISITYGDYVSLIVVVLFINDILKDRFIYSKFFKFWLYYILVLLISGVINFTFFEGPFLNIFKTSIFSVVYFGIVYNQILYKKLTIKKTLVGLGALGIAFLAKTWPEMQNAWAASETEFTNVNIFDSSLNLNTWGFVLVLFLIISMYSWISKTYTKIGLFVSLIFLFFIFFSYSRTAYSLTALIIIVSVFFIYGLNLKKAIKPFLLISLFLIFNNQLNIISFNISDSALSFLDNKSSSYGRDLIDTRFYLINIKPIVDNYNLFNPFQMIFGDGYSVQHSFISHSLVVTGIMGFIVFSKRFFYTYKYCVKTIKQRLSVIPAKFLMLTITIILLNDFVTNISSFLPFAAYLSAIIIALFFAVIENKKHLESKK